jgi:nicotinamide-nucleotide amidase
MNLAERLVAGCTERSITLGTAESLTGGLLATEIAGVPGCSAVFRGAIVAYHPDVKLSILNVSLDLLDHVVSEQVVTAMATGAQRALGVDMALATTGVAGPDPLDGQEPGTVWIAVALGDGEPRASSHFFSGSRDEVRRAAARAALQAGIEFLDG